MSIVEEEIFVSTVLLDVEEVLGSETLLLVEDVFVSVEADFWVLDFSAELVCLIELLSVVADGSLFSLLGDVHPTRNKETNNKIKPNFFI